MKNIFAVEVEQAIADHLYKEHILPRLTGYLHLSDVYLKMQDFIKITDAARLTGIPKSYFYTMYQDCNTGVKFGGETAPIHIHKLDLLKAIGKKVQDREIASVIARLEEKVSKGKKVKNI